MLVLGYTMTYLNEIFPHAKILGTEKKKFKSTLMKYLRLLMDRKGFRVETFFSLFSERQFYQIKGSRFFKVFGENVE